MNKPVKFLVGDENEPNYEKITHSIYERAIRDTLCITESIRTVYLIVMSRMNIGICYNELKEYKIIHIILSC